MKKVLIFFVILALCTSAIAETEYYKSDLFFLYFGKGWKLFNPENNTYQNGNQFLIIQETPCNTGGKGMVALFGKLVYEAAILELFEGTGYLSSEVIEKDGHIIPLIVLSHVNFDWSVISFVLGENAALLVAYVDRTKPDYHTMKERMVEIMLNASAR